MKGSTQCCAYSYNGVIIIIVPHVYLGYYTLNSSVVVRACWLECSHDCTSKRVDEAVSGGKGIEIVLQAVMSRTLEFGQGVFKYISRHLWRILTQGVLTEPRGVTGVTKSRFQAVIYIQ